MKTWDLFTLLPLFVVIRFAFYNSTCAVERFCKDEAYHLMREGHLGKGDLLVGAVIYSLRESVRTADDKHESSDCSLLALYPFGKFDASELQSVLIHQHHGIRRLNQFQNQFTLPFLLLLFAETLGVLEFRNRCYIDSETDSNCLFCKS